MFNRNRKLFSKSTVSAVVASMFGKVVSHAFDPKDPEVVAAIEAAVQAAVAPLVAKRDELLGEVRKLKKNGEIKPEDFERVERERDELQGKLDQAAKDLKTAQKAVETSTAALTGEQAYTQRLLVDNGLNAALLEAGVKNPAHLKAASALIRASSKVEVKVDGDNRSAVIGDKPLADFVKAWAASDDGKHFVSAQVNTGGGANGGNKGIPPDPANAGLSPVDRMHAARTAEAAKT